MKYLIIILFILDSVKYKKGDIVYHKYFKHYYVIESIQKRNTGIYYKGIRTDHKDWEFLSQKVIKKK